MAKQAVNPVRSGPAPVSLESKSAIESVNAELKALSVCAIPEHKPGVSVIVKGNSTPLDARMIRDDECPQCHGYMIGFLGHKYCAECGLKKGTVLERDLKAGKQLHNISQPIIINGNST